MSIIPVFRSFTVVGSVAFRNHIDAIVPGLNRLLPSRRRKLRIAIDTSPKSMSTGQGLKHLWQTVQWSATSVNSSKCRRLTPRRVCSSYRNASISSDVARILLRGLYSRFARGECVAHGDLHLPQRRQSLIDSAIPPMALCSRIRLSAPISEKLGVYALVRSANSPLSRISLPLLKRPSGSTRSL